MEVTRADKVLRWFIEGEQGQIRKEIGGTHILDDDYVPIWVHLSLRTPGEGTRPLKVDITDGGVSIFDDKPALVANQSDVVWTTIPGEVMLEDSVIKLNRDQIANIYSGEDLTVELGLVRA